MNHGVSIRLKNLRRVHQKGSSTIVVLNDVSLDIHAGEMVSVVGPSGSGKSTLMHLLGLLDRPDGGQLELDGQEVGQLSSRARSRIRNARVGYVFQSHNLLPEHSALANVMMPVRLAGSSVDVATKRAAHLLKSVGLGERLTHKPGELSGGEQQRVALARALVMGPGLVLADEPTGNLDPATADGVFNLMLQLNRELGSTLIVVTHSLELARRFPRTLHLGDGMVREDA